MNAGQFEFRGKVRLTAKLSQTVSDWWKKILLKPVDPIFAKNGVGTEVPIRISGTKNSPKIGFDLGHRKPATDKSQ